MSEGHVPRLEVWVVFNTNILGDCLDLYVYPAASCNIVSYDFLFTWHRLLSPHTDVLKPTTIKDMMPVGIGYTSV